MKKGFLMSEDSQSSKLSGDTQCLPRTEEGKFTFDHFELERFIGRGNFCEVFEVTEKGTKNRFALKVFDRSEVMRLNKVADVRMERHAMLRLATPGHPNIISLVETFKDKFRVCLLYELAEAGELWDRIQFAGALDHDWGRSVVSQVVSAVEYVHSKNIVHRDIKAENFVLMKDGTVKLIDFGTAMDLDHPEIPAPFLGSVPPSLAKYVPGGTEKPTVTRPVRRMTFQHYVGTPQFMAPESIKNKDSGKLRDLWSLGCTIYQILAGTPPFSGSSDYFVFLRVEDRHLEFPPNFNPLARDLIERLLVPEPERRLGAGGFSEIKNHPYFQSSSESLSGEFVPKRLLPPLQELCSRTILKKFHSILVEAGDALRSDGDTSQAGADEEDRRGCSRANLSNRDSKDTLQEKGNDAASCISPPVKESEAGLTEKNASTPSKANVAEEIIPSTTPKAGNLKGFSEQQKDRLLDRMISRSLREIPREKMPRHLRLLVDRLEFALNSFSSQLARECTLAETWRQEQQGASDTSSSCSADEDEPPASEQVSSEKREDAGEEATACSVTE